MIAIWLERIIWIYTALGVVFTTPFLFKGVQKIDPSAAAGSWGFRLMISPGCVLFWPLLAYRWWRKIPPPIEQNAHRRSF
ncbi:MAG: hypothetical protein KDC35_02450 [Acidobacteria bacterium]|nr:hypothetical protein [Acidobacteriota bacterium]